MIPGSSMVEQEAVNFEVAGSSPVPGATKKTMPFRHYFFSPLLPQTDIYRVRFLP